MQTTWIFNYESFDYELISADELFEWVWPYCGAGAWRLN